MAESIKDIRWIQRFSNFKKALDKLTVAVELTGKVNNLDDSMAELLREGLIQRFEYTHELAWNVMKDYAEYQGYTDVRGSRDAMRKAFEMNLISDKIWMDSINDRNITSHSYDEETSQDIYSSIINDYYPLFCDFRNVMDKLTQEE